ncbi:4667_t:CDS:1, partial [Racocetra persica]
MLDPNKFFQERSICKWQVIPIEFSGSHYCPVKLLKKYLLIRPVTSDDKPLFFIKTRETINSGAVGATVKRIARHASLRGRFTAYSIRFGGATTAMEAGMSLAQIRAI